MTFQARCGRCGFDGCFVEITVVHSLNLPRHIQVLFLIFFISNLIHFVHNAEYIAFYPGLPAWLTREKVYLAWVAGVSLGLSGLLLARTRFKPIGVALVAAYGATGIDGLAHDMVGLCSEHTLATNLTIWFEVLAGMTLLLASGLLMSRGISKRLKNGLNS